MRNRHLDKILVRLDDLDAVNLAHLVQRLAKERMLLEKLFDAIQEGILVVNEGGILEYSNAAAHRMIGLCEKETPECPLWKVAPELARCLPLKMSDKGPEATVIAREIELTYPESKYVRVYMVPFHLEKERRFAIILDDITDDAQATEARIESERTSSIFVLAAEVAHEIGNPLNSLNIHLQLLQRKLQGLAQADTLAPSVAICINEVQRLDGILKNFLEAIKPQPLALDDLNIFTLLEEVLALLSQELSQLGIQVSVEANPDMPPVLLDGNQVKQVLFNVLKNAMEAMDSGGTIRFYTRSDDEFLYVYIADEGKGIEPEDVGQLFRPFFTTKANGHGLGMMIVQRILRAHGGQVGIDSKPNIGTIVTLQFPLKARRMRRIEHKESL
ncbi:MAG: hypothetical protein A2Y14_05755 [Verrucomicrobia bacterium GWF2_51_19]|nr:MAG: hypothetical protein A2Y14_05755 [Verrucomicrobia bacterium GWF2_51_19]HCJ12155.1 PAS domain-containing sensor histidine kinase [Opitutae bacterium]